MHTCENVVECRLYIRRIQGGCLNEGELIGFSKGLGLVRGHSSQVTEVRLVAHQHDHDVGIGMVPQFAQPSFHILVRQVFGNVIY